MELPFEIAVAGAVTGLTYGLLAIGLVLVYRSSRFINFAHADIGAFGAAILSLLVMRFGVHYWVAFPLALAVGGGVGAATETLVVRRLAKAPRLLSMIATLVLGQFLLVFSLVVNSTGLSGAVFPQPPGIPGPYLWGAENFLTAEIAMAMLTPVVVIGLIVFFRRSRFGMAIRAAAANPDAASLAGMSPRAMATASWAIAGALAAFTAILVIPTLGLALGLSLGPSLLLPGLAAAVIGRMRNLGIAFSAAVVIGMVESVVSFNFDNAGPVSMILFVVILVVLLFQSAEGSRERDRGSWLSVQPWRPLPGAVADLRAVKGVNWALALVVLVGAALIPVTATNEVAFVMTAVLGYAIVGLSIGFVTGMNGQLALGQFAVAAFGAWASWYVSSRTNSFEAGILTAGGMGAAVSVLIGLPALRVRGLLLAVTTLAFALAAQGWILTQDWMFGGGVDPGRPIIASNPLDTAREYYVIALVLFVVAALVMRNLRSSGLGQRLVALRDNEDAARAFTVDLRSDTMRAYALAGAFAGIGGAVYGHSLPALAKDFFLASESINVVAMTVIGGVGMLVGPLVGALYVVAIPRLVDLDMAGRALHTFAILLVIIASPGGLSGLVAPVRSRYVRWAARRRGIELDEQLGSAIEGDEQVRPTVTVGSTNGHATIADEPLLVVEAVSKHYGGITAVDGMDLVVRPGQTVGLVGPNGAGKTTFFEIISGFVTPDEGRVIFDGLDVTRVAPEVRAGLGVVRSFQEAALFPTMTVLDTVELAHERLHPSGLLDAVSGRSRTRRANRERARDLLALMGLDDFRDKQVAELSTGTRRIAELTCMLALEPRLLLLDEPASGVAQKETEALGDLLQGVKRQLGTTMIVIEHDIPLLASICDHMVAMESGRLLVAGTPDEVQSSDAVVESFLGGDITAVQRSGAVTTAKAPA